MNLIYEYKPMLLSRELGGIALRRSPQSEANNSQLYEPPAETKHLLRFDNNRGRLNLLRYPVFFRCFIDMSAELVRLRTISLHRAYWHEMSNN
jgi:hypothetical protein